MYENQNMQQDQERELGWDDSIQKEREFILIPDGEYDFLVKSYKRARHTPKANANADALPACHKAIVTIEIVALINGQPKKVEILHNLFLHSRTESMLSEFFTSIGQKKQGQPVTMNWNAVPGSTGRCTVGQKEYNGNKYNEIKKFHPKADTTFDIATGTNYNPGTF